MVHFWHLDRFIFGTYGYLSDSLLGAKNEPVARFFELLQVPKVNTFLDLASLCTF